MLVENYWTAQEERRKDSFGFIYCAWALFRSINLVLYGVQEDENLQKHVELGRRKYFTNVQSGGNRSITVCYVCICIWN